MKILLFFPNSVFVVVSLVFGWKFGYLKIAVRSFAFFLFGWLLQFFRYSLFLFGVCDHAIMSSDYIYVCVFVYCITHHTTTTTDDDDDDDDDVELTRNDQEKRKIHSKKKMVNNERSYLIILNVKTHTHTECDHIFLFCWLIFSHIIMIHMIILIVSSGPFEPKKKQKTNSDSWIDSVNHPLIF